MIDDLISRNKRLEAKLNNINEEIQSKKARTDHDESLMIPKTEQNMFLKMAEAAMSFDGGSVGVKATANATVRSEIIPAKTSQRHGNNLLIDGGDRYATHEKRDKKNIKDKRVFKIMTELKSSIETGEPISVETNEIVRRALLHQ